MLVHRLMPNVANLASRFRRAVVIVAHARRKCRRDQQHHGHCDEQALVSV
jgi:hypothetical protein